MHFYSQVKKTIDNVQLAINRNKPFLVS